MKFLRGRSILDVDSSKNSAPIDIIYGHSKNLIRDTAQLAEEFALALPKDKGVAIINTVHHEDQFFAYCSPRVRRLGITNRIQLCTMIHGFHSMLTTIQNVACMRKTPIIIISTFDFAALSTVHRKLLVEKLRVFRQQYNTRFILMMENSPVNSDRLTGANLLLSQVTRLTLPLSSTLLECKARRKQRRQGKLEAIRKPEGLIQDAVVVREVNECQTPIGTAVTEAPASSDILTGPPPVPNIDELMNFAMEDYDRNAAEAIARAAPQDPKGSMYSVSELQRPQYANAGARV